SSGSAAGTCRVCASASGARRPASTPWTTFSGRSPTRRRRCWRRGSRSPPTRWRRSCARACGRRWTASTRRERRARCERRDRHEVQHPRRAGRMSGARADSPRLIERLTAPVERFLGLETSSSILLLAATVLALAWANSPWAASYGHLLHVPFALRIGDFELAMSFAHVVNDALMGIFFFVVGMEIKRELVIGGLSSPSRALLPVLAAAGGMIVPAGIYASLHWGEPTLRGWGIPMATDIAFAVAALSAFGRRVPPGLKIFLLALAIADDIGAVSVIAIFYTAELSVEWLAWAAAGLAFTYAMNLAGVRHYAAYIAIGGVVWFATYQSGVHATIAGVALGLITPARPLAPPPDRETLLQRGMHWLERLGQAVEGENDHGGHARYEIRRRLDATARATLSPADDLIHVLHPWVAFVIMPVFALANAGVPLDPATLGQPDAMRVGAAVAAGLLI